MAHVHVDLAHLAALRPHKTRLKDRRARILRAVRPSVPVELWYRAELDAIAGKLKAAGAHIANALRPSWPVVRDESVPGLGNLLAELAAKFGNIQGVAEKLAMLAARKNLMEVDERLARAIENSIGVDISPFFRGPGPVSETLYRKAAENVDLIISIPEQYRESLRELVTKQFVAGVRWEEMAAKITKLGDMTETRAWTIARDQTSKMNAAFNQSRQTSLGIEEYDWSGALDIRERPSHRAMEGKRFRWDSPPELDGERVNPGEPILCRCVGLPVVNLEKFSLGAGTALEEAA